MSNKGLFKGLALGALVGAAAGLLFAPKAGKETREDLKKLAVTLKEKAEDMYVDAKAMVMERTEQLKLAGSKIDEKRYMSIVSDVVAELKSDGVLAGKALNKLSSQLKRDWSEVKEVFETK